MQIDLSGKTALITGSTGGIGFAIAKGLSEAGAAVIVNGRTQPRSDEAAARIGLGARGIGADVGTAEGAAALVAALPKVDILVNNAGIFEPADFFETPDEVWDRHWQVNVMSAVRLSRAYAPAMVEAGWGRILFLASESAFNQPVEMIHYGVSKTADVAVARGLAKRLAGTNVTVNSVLPGPTLSEGVAEMLASETAQGKSLTDAAADFVKAHRPGSLIQRAATTEEVANLVVYLASPLASATTGAAMRVDGGLMDTL